MKQLLVVDDEVDIRSFLKEFFEDRGYAVVTAANPEEARGVLERERPQVALLDILMKTKEDGIDLLMLNTTEAVNPKLEEKEIGTA